MISKRRIIPKIFLISSSITGIQFIITHPPAPDKLPGCFCVVPEEASCWHSGGGRGTGVSQYLLFIAASCRMMEISLTFSAIFTIITSTAAAGGLHFESEVDLCPEQAVFSLFLCQCDRSFSLFGRTAAVRGKIHIFISE
ncbi:MAG: hypothetical protein IJI08_09965, partial [Clostridia bacterium]|nr:hypothetical protein [Clostridia bacterium]